MATKQIITVLDLPQLYKQPSAAELITTLKLLTLKPASWGDDNSQQDSHTHTAVDDEGIPKYLTGIIASQLSWIADGRKEEIWEYASRRLSERSGRTAIPSISRTFVIPNPATNISLEITLHEPSLTSDNLGHKTWVASYLLAKRLPYLLPYLTTLSLLHDTNMLNSVSLSSKSPTHIVELGAGTGLVGIAAAALFHANVHLTDLPAIVPNLFANVTRNNHLLTSIGGRTTTVGVLDWSDLSMGEAQAQFPKVDIILAADPLYSPSHPAWLVSAIVKCLNEGPMARVVVELPLREVYVPEVEEFKRRMETIGFTLVINGEEVGFDDWESCIGGEHKMAEVKCWWGIWAWAEV